MRKHLVGAVAAATAAAGEEQRAEALHVAAQVAGGPVAGFAVEDGEGAVVRAGNEAAGLVLEV